jgi:hypothetical protein
LALRKQPPDDLSPRDYVRKVEVVRAAGPYLIIILLVGVIFSTAIVVLGLTLPFLLHNGNTAQSNIDFLGLMKISTTNVQIALVAIGVVGNYWSIRRVLTSFDRL